MGGYTRAEYDELPEILTAEQAAKLLGVSEQTLRKWVDAGEVPAVQIASRWRFSKTRLEQFIASS